MTGNRLTTCGVYNDVDRLLLYAVLAIAVLGGCSKAPPASPAKQQPSADALVRSIPWEDVAQLDLGCRDDTLRHTDHFGGPVARFAEGTTKLNGRVIGNQELEKWAKEYYRNKFEKGLWIQVAQGNDSSAGQALAPLIRAFPDIRIRRISLEFSCARSGGR